MKRHVIVADERIRRIGLGTYGYGEAYGGITKIDALRIIRILVEQLPPGEKILIDTAPRYACGLVETWLGEFSQRWPKKILIATKGGRHIDEGRVNEKDFSADFLRRDLEGSLDRLRTDQIFLYQLHNPSLEILKKGDVFNLLEEFRSQGKIRHYGVSINDPEEGIAAIDTCREKGYSGLATIQVIYNVFEKRGRKQLFAHAKAAGILVIVRESLHRGFLTGKHIGKTDFSREAPAVRKQARLYGAGQLSDMVKFFCDTVRLFGVPPTQAALGFVLEHSAATMVIPGINRMPYVEEDWPFHELSTDLLSALRALADIEKL